MIKIYLKRFFGQFWEHFCFGPGLAKNSMKIARRPPWFKKAYQIYFFCFRAPPPHDVLGVESQFWYLPEQPARLLACVPACLLACFNCLLVFRVLACLRASVLARLFACFSCLLLWLLACFACVLACLLLAGVLACLLAWSPACILGQGQWGTKATPLHTHTSPSGLTFSFAFQHAHIVC